MDGFTGLVVWKRGCRFCEVIHAEFDDCPNSSFRDQITRASLSIPCNVAEGYERGSSKDFIRFLRFARRSSAEVRTQLPIGARVGLLDSRRLHELVIEAREISKMLQGLIV